MKIRKICLFLVFTMLFISVNVLTVSAEGDSNVFNTLDLDYSALVLNYPESVGADNPSYDVTDSITVSTVSSGVFSNMIKYAFPLSNTFETSRVSAILCINNDLNFIAGHSYNISFDYGVDWSLPFHCDIYLYFYDTSGELLKTQTVANLSHKSTESNTVHTCDVNFVPDISDITEGYYTEFQICFTQTGNNYSYTNNFYVSPEITLTDFDDNSGLLLQILSAILQLDSNIDTYITDLESSLISQLITLDNNIDNYFDELGGTLASAISELDTNIDGYFELLKNGIIENDNALSDKLHEYLDKYRPRFYESFHWQYGAVNSSGGIVNSDSSSLVSNLFVVDEFPYFFDFTPSNVFNSLYVYVYDHSGHLLTRYSFSSNISRDLLVGYAYRFVLNSNSALNFDSDTLNMHCNSCLEVYSDEGWLTSFSRYIVREFNLIMNPGVYEDPGEDEFQQNKDEWDQVESELPSFDSEDMKEVDITDYTGGFGAVRYLFDRFLNASGLTTLISFSLMFGLGVFLIGRKVGG